MNTDQLDSRKALRHMASGSAWMIAMRWSMRGIGVVSTIILARLLAPQDFGIIAMAMLMVGFIEMLAETGLHLALIRNAKADRHLYDTAWTLSVLQGFVLCALIVALAPLAALYFEEPRATAVLYVLALRPFINGLQNIGTVAFLKELDFAKDFRFGIYQKLTAFVVTITLAYVLRNYWALAYGIVTSSVAGVVLSYAMHPYRPRWCLARVRQLYGFSLNMLAQALSYFLTGKIDEIVVGGNFGTETMGHYHIAADVGTSPTYELTEPMARSLFPIYAKLSHQHGELSGAYLHALSAIAVLACASGAGIFSVAEPLVLAVLGEKWTDTAPLMSWLALAMAMMVIGNTCFAVLNATGSERLALRLTCLRTLVLGGLLAPVAAVLSVEAVAVTRFAVMAAFLPVFLVFTARVLDLSPLDPVRAIWRPAVAALLMTATLKLLPADAVHHAAPQLIIEVALGAFVFVCGLIGLWLLAGRPDGIERTALGFLAGLRRGLVQP
jgi:O-antigen/teichoic acid export membrane protein